MWEGDPPCFGKATADVVRVGVSIVRERMTQPQI